MTKLILPLTILFYLFIVATVVQLYLCIWVTNTEVDFTRLLFSSLLSGVIAVFGLMFVDHLKDLKK